MTFVQQRFLTKEVPFYDNIPKLKLKTFSSGIAKTFVKVSGREVLLKSDCDFFARHLVTAQSRNIDLREVLTYPFTT